LDQALESLLSQTNKNFMVYVHDDGSTNSESLEFFQKAKSKYEKYGWKFSSATNQGVCESRNYLASLGKSKYLIWMDPDNIAAPDMVDQFIKGMEKSDYDVLTCWSYQFSGDESPYLNCMRGLRKADYHYIPVGNLPEVGMLDNPYGDVNCIMKRSKFYEAGGFTTHYPKNVNHEDRELLTRMSLMDMKIDIIPKFLFFYRIREDSRLRITSEFDNNQRVLDVYNDVKASNVNYRAIAELCLGYKHKDIEQQGHIDYLYKIAGHHIKNSELEVNLSKTVSYKSLLSALKKKVQRRIYTIFSNNY
jgi:glycosyltransferase involved in cell wall biosynthesis